MKGEMTRNNVKKFIFLLKKGLLPNYFSKNYSLYLKDISYYISMLLVLFNNYFKQHLNTWQFLRKRKVSSYTIVQFCRFMVYYIYTAPHYAFWKKK